MNCLSHIPQSTDTDLQIPHLQYDALSLPSPSPPFSISGSVCLSLLSITRIQSSLLRIWVVELSLFMTFNAMPKNSCNTFFHKAHCM